MMFKHLFWIGLLLSLSPTPKAYAGSQGVFGGSEDASVLTGDTFNPGDAIIILEPLVAGLKYDAVREKLNFTDPVAWQTAVNAALSDTLPTTQGVMDESSQLDMNSVPSREAITQIAMPDTSLSFAEAMRLAGGSEDTIAVAEQLAQELNIQPGTRQAETLLTLLLTLQGMTQGDALQLNNAINAYNAFINSLDPSALVAFSNSQQGMDLRSALVKLRNFSTIPQESVNSKQ